MCTGASFAIAIAAIAAASISAQALSRTPSIKADKTPIPSGPATIPDKSNFAAERGIKPLEVPEGISFGAGLTDEQKRSQIATQATSGVTGTYKTPQVQKYYKDLAFRTLTDQAGNPAGEPLGVEKQYIQDILGQTPRQGTTSSFLSALLRS